MGLFNKNKQKGGLMDQIRCDETSYLIWKWHPSGADLGKTSRENSIRWGSSLRVKEGEVAVFVYKQEDGTMQDFIVGPFDDFIKSANFPILTSIIGLAYNGSTPFPAEVYFINLAQIIQVKFAVPYFDVYDPRFTDFGVPIAVRGTISFQIEDYREFIKIHRLINFSLDDFQKQIRDLINRYVKDIITNAPATNKIPVVQIETRIAEINDIIEYRLRQRLKNDFGILVSGVDINAIEVDKTSKEYSHLMAITKNISIEKTEAQVEDYIERLRIKRDEDQYAIHKQTQSTNIGAFQVEKQTEVGIEGAKALGQMGSSQTGSVEFGSDGTGFNMASMMASMALGGAVGQNIAETMNSIMGNLGQVSQSNVPPQIPIVTFYIAVNGKSTGPFELNVISKMIKNGQVTSNSLVWKEGMAEWEKAETIEELKDMFKNSMPPIPPVD